MKKFFLVLVAVFISRQASADWLKANLINPHCPDGYESPACSEVVSVDIWKHLYTTKKNHITESFGTFYAYAEIANSKNSFDCGFVFEGRLDGPFFVHWKFGTHKWEFGASIIAARRPHKIKRGWRVTTGFRQYYIGPHNNYDNPFISIGVWF